ncbi:translation initiation factor IF-2 N-terminal domain-containing protein [Herbiconiux ginsengi]|uniref:translation initiation factor IF-2 N-terminal domain-containing protein n=1 Tax=Herbiconiux ginsengi TaxID=381665 RepID=UPI0015876A1B
MGFEQIATLLKSRAKQVDVDLLANDRYWQSTSVGSYRPTKRGGEVARKPRVHEVTSELGVDVKVAMATLRSMGVFVKGPSSSIEPPVARRLREALIAGGHTLPPSAEQRMRSRTSASR